MRGRRCKRATAPLRALDGQRVGEAVLRHQQGTERDLPSPECCCMGLFKVTLVFELGSADLTRSAPSDCPLHGWLACSSGLGLHMEGTKMGLSQLWPFPSLSSELQQ